MLVPLETIKEMMILAALEWELKTPEDRLGDLALVNEMRGTPVMKGAELLPLIDQLREFIAAHVAGLYVSELVAADDDDSVTGDMTSAWNQMYQAILDVPDWPGVLQDVSAALEWTEPITQ